MNKDHINAKISEALSGALGGDSWEGFRSKFVSEDVRGNQFIDCGQQSVNNMELYFAQEKSKVESEIKSVLETIDWD